MKDPIEENDRHPEDALVEHGRKLREKVQFWITEWWGPRCEDFDPDCDCCKAWAACDNIFQYLDEEEA